MPQNRDGEALFYLRQMPDPHNNFSINGKKNPQKYTILNNSSCFLRPICLKKSLKFH